MKENNKILQLIYVAWRERWSDSQWGINIKKARQMHPTINIHVWVNIL